MLIIRFARRGRKNHAFYDLVLAQKSKAVKKKFIKKLGYFDPHAEKGAGKFVFDTDAIKECVANGAQISDSAAKRLVRAGMKESEKFVAFRAQKPPKPKEEAPAEESAE